MADKIQLIDSQAFMSLIADPGINIGQFQTADMAGILYNSMMPPLPDVARSANTMIGDGNERAQKLRKGWIVPIQIPMAGLLNTETAARIGTRCLGGTRTPGAEISGGSGVYDVITNMQTKAQGRIPVLSTFGFDLGGYKFIFPSLGVTNFEIQFEGSNDVTFTSNLLGTGLYYINDTEGNLAAQGYSAELAAALANPGAFQIETATVAGTITGAGDVSVTVTAAGLTGSPVTVSVPVLVGNTAAQVATRIRAALRLNADIDAFFTVAGTGTSVVLIKKEGGTNDGTLNIALDNDTSTGLTAAPTSANTKAGAAAAVITPPTAPDHHLMHPAATRVTFSDGTTRDFAADGDLISGACGLDNQIVVKQEPGDPFLLASNRKAGAYARDIHRQTRVPSARIKLNPGIDYLPFMIAQNGSEVTSLIFLFRSEDPIGSTEYFYEFEWKCPLSEIETVTSDPDGDDAAVTVNFYPKKDVVTGGYFIQRIRTDLSTIQ